MTWTSRYSGIRTTTILFLWALALPFSTTASAQVFSFPKQELIDYTAQNPFDRLPDGRPEGS